jgi:hypothetical protein
MQVAPGAAAAVRLQLAGVGTKSALFIPVTEMFTPMAAAALLVSVTVSVELLPNRTVPKFSVGTEGATAGPETEIVSDAVPEMPDFVAVIVTGPPDFTPLATPVAAPTVAVVVSEEVHAALVVRFYVLPSEYVPVAVNG